MSSTVFKNFSLLYFLGFLSIFCLKNTDSNSLKKLAKVSKILSLFLQLLRNRWKNVKSFRHAYILQSFGIVLCIFFRISYYFFLGKYKLKPTQKIAQKYLKLYKYFYRSWTVDERMRFFWNTYMLELFGIFLCSYLLNLVSFSSINSINELLECIWNFNQISTGFEK